MTPLDEYGACNKADCDFCDDIYLPGSVSCIRCHYRKKLTCEDKWPIGEYKDCPDCGEVAGVEHWLI